MKRLSVFIFVLFFTIGAAFSQNGQSPVMQFDEAVNYLAGEIHSVLIAKGAESVFIGQFTFQASTPTFISYWINQLTDELVNIPGRRYRVSSSGNASGDTAWTISGEIVQIADIFRVYTRLIRVSDRAIEGSFTSSFQRDTHINEMIYNDNSSAGGSSSASGGTDTYERDDWDYPLFYDLGTNPNVTVINRALSEDDEDFFLIIPDMDGQLTAETTGNTDTYMFLYDYETGDELASNDDGGTGTNAQIRYNVRAGVSYLVIVCGYSYSTTGSYGFRAYLTAREGSSSYGNPISYEIGSSEETASTLNRTLGQGDEDYYILLPAISGRLTMETTGRTDTYMELYDSDRVLLERNDDGGTNSNARIRYNVTAGSAYFVKVRGYSQNTTGSYGFRAFFPGSSLPPPDEYEPNDEPSRAGNYEIGTDQRHTFHSADDVDWITFQITRAGRYIISARGVNSNRLDTYIELFDANLNRIAEDDDGGDSLSSRLSLNLTAGVYYLKVWCLDSEPDQGYILNISAAQ